MYNVILVEEQQRVEHRQHRLVHKAHEHDIFEVYESKRLLDFGHDRRIIKLDDLVEARLVT